MFLLICLLIVPKLLSPPWKLKTFQTHRNKSEYFYFTFLVYFVLVGRFCLFVYLNANIFVPLWSLFIRGFCCLFIRLFCLYICAFVLVVSV